MTKTQEPEGMKDQKNPYVIYNLDNQLSTNQNLTLINATSYNKIKSNMENCSGAVLCNQFGLFECQTSPPLSLSELGTGT